MHFEEKDEVHSLNISEVIDSEKYGYLNAQKVPFYNTFGQSMCSRVSITAESSTAELSSKFSIKPRQIELENISFSQM